jgi:hypothetical protein
MLVSAASGTATDIILGSTFISPLRLNGVTQHTVRAHPIILALSKKLEPSWRLSKGKEAHQSIHCRQRKLVPFYPTFKQQPPVAMPLADIENRTIPGGPNGSNISINIVLP